MRFSQTVHLFGVAIAVTGTYERAEAPSRDYPGSKAEVYPISATISETDVMPLIDAADWWEPLEKRFYPLLANPRTKPDRPGRV